MTSAHGPDDLLRLIREKVADIEPGQLLGELLGFAAPAAMPRRPRRSLRRPPRAEVATYRIRVDLDHAKPPIWRRLELRSDLTLDEVHDVLQTAYGWFDCHLHRFALGGSVWDLDSEAFLCPYDAEEGGTGEGVPASSVRLDETLAEPGDTLRYVYDYGDSWELTLRLERVLPREEGAPAAVCVGGRRAAPPEDSGGWVDAESLGQVLDDPAYFDVEEVNDALASGPAAAEDDDDAVDARLVDLILQLTRSEVGAELVHRLLVLTEPAMAPAEKETALRPVAWFLDRVGDAGLPLTSSGYLKPADVAATAQVLPAGREWIGARNREVQTFPVLRFREGLQRLGLVRRYRGRLLLTTAGSAVRGDPEALWAHLAERLPLGRDGTMELPAELLALLVAATDTDEPLRLDLVAAALTELGWRGGDHGAGRVGAISTAAVRESIGHTLAVLDSLRAAPRLRGVNEPLSPAATELARDALLRN